MASEWHYSREGKRYGPVPLSELKKLAEAGKLAPSDFVWKEGLPEWVEASSIKGLLPTEDRSSSQCPPPLPAEAVREEPTSLSQGFLTPELHAKAEHNQLQAQFKLNECQAHLGVYGNRLVSVARDGLEFIEVALRINPESSAYWLFQTSPGVGTGLNRHQAEHPERRAAQAAVKGLSRNVLGSGSKRLRHVHCTLYTFRKIIE
jgi:hypothetical protein